jgi:ribosomal protein S16
MRPELVINPRQDTLLRERAEQAVGGGAQSTDAVEAILQPEHPRIVVHRRELSGERRPAWYVYREGDWTREDP